VKSALAVCAAMLVLVGGRFNSVGDSAPFALGNQALAAAPPRPPAHGVQYGLIEVGSKGVKAYVFDLAYAQSGPGCNADPEAHLKCLNPYVLDTINTNPIEEAQIQVTADAVVAMKAMLKTTYNVSDANLFVVGSSGIGAEEHLQRLSESINRVAELPPGHEIEYISKDAESIFGFTGVMSMLPKPWNVTRRTQALLIDFGSGNTKGAYSETQDYSRPLATFAVPWGTKSVTDYVDHARGATGDFTPEAEKFRESTLVPQMRAQFQNETSAMSRPRVYVIGGIIWAISNLSRPQYQHDKVKYAPVTQADIDLIYAKATAPNGYATLCGDNPDKAIDPDISAVCKTFSVNNLIAGLELVKAYAKEMDFANKKVFFFRDSLYAWPMGYLEHKIYPNMKGH
jgi:hypothetical protein